MGTKWDNIYQNQNEYPVFVPNRDGSFRRTLFKGDWFKADDDFHDRATVGDDPALAKVETEEELIPKPSTVRMPRKHPPRIVREEDLYALPIKKLVARAKEMGFEATEDDSKEAIISRIVRRW